MQIKTRIVCFIVEKILKIYKVVFLLKSPFLLTLGDSGANRKTCRPSLRQRVTFNA